MRPREAKPFTRRFESDTEGELAPNKENFK